MTHPKSGAGSGGDSQKHEDNWWVGEQFNADGSATYVVAQYTGSPGGHPEPKDNQIWYGPYKTEEQAHGAENRTGQLAAPHVYRGKNVGKGPGGLNIPKDQGPTVPNPLRGITELGASVEGFFNVLTDGKMWRSLGWLGLGIVLIAMGINLWLKLPEKFMSAAETGAKAAAL